MLVVLCISTAYRYPAVETIHGEETPIESFSCSKWEKIGTLGFIFISRYDHLTYQEGPVYVKEIHGKILYRIKFHKEYYILNPGTYSYNCVNYNASFESRSGTGYLNI